MTWQDSDRVPQRQSINRLPSITNTKNVAAGSAFEAKPTRHAIAASTISVSSES
jgi:hypothetical protein